MNDATEWNRTNQDRAVHTDFSMGWNRSPMEKKSLRELKLSLKIDCQSGSKKRQYIEPLDNLHLCWGTKFSNRRKAIEEYFLEFNPDKVERGS